MSFSNEDSKFAFATDKLRKVAPQEWSEFLAAFHNFSDRERAKVISSPPERLPVIQGRAQVCHDLLQLFEASKEADQIQEKLNERRAQLSFRQADSARSY
jgi:hypothetical protein